jgi:hypothetical protein
MEDGPSLEANSRSASLEIIRLLMKPEGSYKPTTWPYPDPDQSSPQRYTLRFISILSSYSNPDLTNGLFVSGFPNTILYEFSYLPCMLQDPRSTFYEDLKEF